MTRPGGWPHGFQHGRIVGSHGDTQGFKLALGAKRRGRRGRRGDGPVTLLVPYTPGTGPDLLARLLSPALQQALGQPVVVENRAGASGNIGTQAVARAAPDGRTLLLQANTFVMNPSLFRQVPYDPVGSFTPVIRISRGDLVLAVNPEVSRPRDAAGFGVPRPDPGRWTMPARYRHAAAPGHGALWAGGAGQG